MTISRKEKRVPKDLPPARLFLDDLEMVIRVFQEAKQSQTENPENPAGLTAKEQPTLKFEIEDHVCTELTDLPKIAETTHNFTMQVDFPDFSAFLQISPSSTRWDTYGLTTTEDWSLHSKLEPIFQARERPLTALVHRIPSSFLWLGLGILGTLILFPLLVKYSLPFMSYGIPLYRALLPPAVALVLLLIVHASLTSTHTILVLRPYSESSAQRRESANRKAWDFAKILLAAVLAVAGTLLTQFLIHKVWPKP